jgi:hypothetical protein
VIHLFRLFGDRLPLADLDAIGAVEEEECGQSGSEGGFMHDVPQGNMDPPRGQGPLGFPGGIAIGCLWHELLSLFTWNPQQG